MKQNVCNWKKMINWNQDKKVMHAKLNIIRNMFLISQDGLQIKTGRCFKGNNKLIYINKSEYWASTVELGLTIEIHIDALITRTLNTLFGTLQKFLGL